MSRLGAILFAVWLLLLVVPVVMFLASPIQVGGDPISPIKRGQMMLSESVTYLRSEPKVGDRVVFNNPNSDVRWVGVVTGKENINGKELFVIVSSPSRAPWVIARAGIKSKIYFPIMDNADVIMAVKSAVPNNLDTSLKLSSGKEFYRSEYRIVKGSQIIATSSGGIDSKNIVKVNDFLFYTRDFGKKLEVLNIKSGEIKTIFEEPKDSQGGIHNLVILGNELYFGLIGYMDPRKVFYVSLSSNDFKPIEITDTAFRLEKIGNEYFLIGGFGDGCGGNKTYTYFNPDSKEQRFIFDSHLGCNMGEEFIGFDEQDRFLVASHSAILGEDYIFPGKYTSLSAIPVSDSQNKVVLVPEGNVPKDVLNVSYLQKSKKVAFINDYLTVYSLESKELTPLMKLPFPKESKNIYINSFEIEENKMCIAITNSFITENYLVDLITKKVTNSKDCEVANSGKINYDESELGYLRSLDLPPEYKVVSVKLEN